MIKWFLKYLNLLYKKFYSNYAAKSDKSIITGWKKNSIPKYDQDEKTWKKKKTRTRVAVARHRSRPRVGAGDPWRVFRTVDFRHHHHHQQHLSRVLTRATSRLFCVLLLLMFRFSSYSHYLRRCTPELRYRKITATYAWALFGVGNSPGGRPRKSIGSSYPTFFTSLFWILFFWSRAFRNTWVANIQHEIFFLIFIQSGPPLIRLILIIVLILTTLHFSIRKSE